MARHDDRVTLRQMLESTEKAIFLGETRSRLGLDEDWVTTLALVQLLQIVGEAARRVSEHLRQQHPEVPWAQIIGLRNRLIHGYDTVDLDRLWEVLTADLPELKANLTRILQPLS
jgi:uncharacterized protein with HEPN domain